MLNIGVAQQLVGAPLKAEFSVTTNNSSTTDLHREKTLEGAIYPLPQGSSSVEDQVCCILLITIIENSSVVKQGTDKWVCALGLGSVAVHSFLGGRRVCSM